MDVTYRIVAKKQLSENVFQVEVNAPLVARARKAGQFVIVSPDVETGERIPLTIAGADTDQGTIRLIFQRVGKTTIQMADIPVGGSLGYVAGPLGKPTHVEKVGTVVCVGGGIGNAPLLPIATAMKEAGNTVISILGARNKELVILEEEFAALSDEMVIVTDDGSYGRKALVTEPLKEICSRSPKPELAIVIGPTIMIDGTGMCGGCRVEVGGKTKFVCVDGPEFDGHQVNFDQMMRRMTAFKDLEKRATEQYQEHKCKIGLK